MQPNLKAGQLKGMIYFNNATEDGISHSIYFLPMVNDKY